MRKIRVYGEPTWVPGSVQGMPSPDGDFVRFGRVLGGNLGPNGRRSGARVLGFASPCAPFPAATPRHRVKTGMRASSARKGWEHVKAGAVKNERVGGGDRASDGSRYQMVASCGSAMRAAPGRRQATMPSPAARPAGSWTNSGVHRNNPAATSAFPNKIHCPGSSHRAAPAFAANPFKRCF